MALIFITGATGMIGRRIVVDRLERGDRVRILSRSRSRAERLFAAPENPSVEIVEGDPAIPGAWQQAVDGTDAVIHLAGAGLADRRWNPSYKRIILESRVDGTHQVVEAILAARRAPAVLISSSAIGWYGEGGDAQWDESRVTPGTDFLAHVCVQWEETARAAASRCRVVMLRTGLVLDARGGALAPMLKVFRLGLGGPIGLGRQWVSWIHWRDLVRLVDRVIADPACTGPVNATAPNPVPQRRFAQALGRALRRPTLLPAPPIAVRVALGEFGNYALVSQRVVPGKAQAAGFEFQYPEIDAALRAVVPGRDERRSPSSVAAPPAALPAGPMPAQRVRIVAIGVDGTLLRRDGRLPQGVVLACRQAQQAGCAVVLATARAPRGVRAFVQAMGLKAPIVAYNGALIWNPQTNQALHHDALDERTAREVVARALAAAPNLIIGIERLDRWYASRLLPGWERQGIRPDGVGPADQFLLSPVTQINLYGDEMDIERARAVIDAQFWSARRVARFRVEQTLLQVSAPLTDKAIALQRLAGRVGCPREAVMAIGDGANDLGMIEWAGFGVAVENAIPDAHRLAKAVVPGCDENGVARAIHRYILSAH